MTYYRSTVVDVGPEARDMVAAGVVILFGEPLPDALAEVSVVHRPSQTLDGHAIGVGDTVVIGGQELTIAAVGDIATKNLDELGHVVLYLNTAAERQPVPGAVFATGELSVVEPGHEIEFRAGS
jgi:PTS system glucitol/sorbitol-specific IIA component